MNESLRALELADWLERRTNIMLQDRKAAAELRRLADIEHEHRALLVNEQNLREELAAIKASMGEPVRHEWRWLNPADAKVHPDELEWKTPMPKNLESQQEFIDRLLFYRYNEKPVYEVRALYALTNKDQS